MSRPPYELVRLYLGWHAATSTMFGLELLLAPHRLISGPATATVYSLRPPWQWGIVFITLAAICGAAAYRPLHVWRLAMIALQVAQVCWALALLAPLLTVGRTNLLASCPWIALAATSMLVARLTTLEEAQRRHQARET